MKHFYLQLLAIILITNTINSQDLKGNAIYGESSFDQSGWSVATSYDGSIIAIGSPNNDNSNGNDSGQVQVFFFTNNNWVQMGNDINGSDTGLKAGTSVALSANGTIVAIGSPYFDTQRGKVQVYEFTNGSWSQLGDDIIGEELTDLSGASISLSHIGNILAIGAPVNSSGTGHVRVFELTNNNWTQLGEDIDGEFAQDKSGTSVSLNNTGLTVAIGAPENNSRRGQVRVYNYNGTSWAKVGEDINGNSDIDVFGTSVELSDDGNTLIAGGHGNDGSFNNAGYAKIYEFSGTNWIQKGTSINGEAEDDFSGWSVSISGNGDIVSVGSRHNDGSFNKAGHIRLFKFSENNWVQLGNDIDGLAADNLFGFSTSLSNDGTTLIGGAPNSDENGNKSGSVRVFDITQATLDISTYSLTNNIFNIFPNPAVTEISISLKDNSVLKKLNIYNSFSQLIITTKESNVDVSKLSKGIYIIEVLTSKGKESKKLIIK